jgi:hypothetical protein
MRVGAEASADDTPQCLPDLSVESFGVGTALSRSLPPDASPYSQLGRLGVTLMLVSDSKHVVLIHGSWRRGACPGSIRRPGLHSAHPNAALSRAAFARGRREDRVTEHPGLHRRPSGSRRRPEFPTPSCRAFPGWSSSSASRRAKLPCRADRGLPTCDRPIRTEPHDGENLPPTCATTATMVQAGVSPTQGTVPALNRL